MHWRKPVGADGVFHDVVPAMVGLARESGEFLTSPLAQIPAEVAATRQRPREAGEAVAIRQIAEIVSFDGRNAAATLARFGEQPTATLDVLKRHFADAWMEGEREAYSQTEQALPA